ncbi:O-antigen ligase family protein [Sphingomonas sp. M1-B02]|uniref:O-antigen ligase family protein n=1 Tax=Sphingomonas sp. M1-B02 TaxID=3114300 RepID=UPI0022407283|nr:O-antigen ligase family protein [Sphingomonas sp. S6-11]UZK67745.1 O-antigen ligase family protein [Sphingomonas sp. S6-11]
MLVAAPDAIALAVILALPLKGKIYSPALIAYIAYAAVLTASLLSSTNEMSSFFYIWQILRMIILIVAVTCITSSPSGARYIIYGFAVGIMFQAGFSISQRLNGVVQASGTMGHQNLLGMMTHFALLGCLGLMLCGDKRWILKWGLAASLVVVVLSGSRGTLAFAGVGAGVLILLSLIRRPNKTKMKVAAVGFLGIIAAAPIAYITLSDRFAEAPLDGTYDERLHFERAARAMISDYPFGVGANNYVVIANTKGYSDRAGVVWSMGSRAANVHNVFLLTAAETGYLGAIAFSCILFVGAIVAFNLGWTRRGAFPYADLCLGISVMASIVTVHSLYEWVLITQEPQYLLAIVLGMSAGLNYQRTLNARSEIPNGRHTRGRAKPMPQAIESMVAR